MSWIEWLNSNHGLISAIATVVIAFFAIITAWLTKALANENRLMRKSDTEPLLSWHQRTGALVPLLFYVHSVEIGYGYLAALTVSSWATCWTGPSAGCAVHGSLGGGTPKPSHSTVLPAAPGGWEA